VSGPDLQNGLALVVEVEQTLPMPLQALALRGGELLALVGPSGAARPR
jgi:hypothetical protein